MDQEHGKRVWIAPRLETIPIGSTAIKNANANESGGLACGPANNTTPNCPTFS